MTKTDSTRLELVSYHDGQAVFEAPDPISTLAGHDHAARVAMLELARSAWTELGRPTSVVVTFTVEAR